MSGREGGAWEPGQYLRFGGHRLRPALELFQRVEHDAVGLAVEYGLRHGRYRPCDGGALARRRGART